MGFRILLATWAVSLCAAAAAAEEEPFAEWIAARAAALEWNLPPVERSLTRATLLESLNLGRDFLLANQKPEGNFNYTYDWITRLLERSDNQVRQAGAVWGVALIDHFRSDAETRQALDRALDFFLSRNVSLPDGAGLAATYPGEPASKTGTVALLALALIERLREDDAPRPPLSAQRRSQLEAALDGYLGFLRGAQREDGHFLPEWRFASERFEGAPNPYADGEALLAFSKAARLLGRTELVPVVERTAPILARDYTQRAWPEDPDSKLTKGFFQWGCMAFAEHRAAGWKGSETLGDTILTLGWWMIHVHETLERRRNTAYAYEGLAQAYRVAALRRDSAARRELRDVIDGGLRNLTSWQVGGPLQSQNRFLSLVPTRDPLAIGGGMNAADEAPLRIDVTQHQMHAVILALRHVLPE
jgi:UDP-N-acetylmuramoyl-tripeptide--D-alanyl-D-alanine ligase